MMADFQWAENVYTLNNAYENSPRVSEFALCRSDWSLERVENTNKNCIFLIKKNGQTREGAGQSVTQQLWLEEYNCVVDMSAKQLTRVRDSPATERVICLQRGGEKGWAVVRHKFKLLNLHLFRELVPNSFFFLITKLHISFHFILRFEMQLLAQVLQSDFGSRGVCMIRRCPRGFSPGTAVPRPRSKNTHLRLKNFKLPGCARVGGEQSGDQDVVPPLGCLQEHTGKSH